MIYKVFLTGGDKVGWALDTELELTKRSLPFVKFSNLFFCNIIHTISWPTLLRIPSELLIGKRVISHLTHDTEVALNDQKFEQVAHLVSLWVLHSRRAFERFDQRGLKSVVIPYTYDENVFKFIAKENELIKNIKLRWGMPANKYLIGSFQRDTEGKDLSSPKLVKGPDIFLEIVAKVFEQRKDIHIVLAGPRRYWIIRNLEKRGIPFTYVGETVSGDDLLINNLSQEVINLLYNMIDLYLVSSRSEGGPQAIIESAAAKCKVISTPVGHSEDILDHSCIYTKADDAVKVIVEDIKTNNLSSTVEKNLLTVKSNHSINAAKEKWFEAYTELLQSPTINMDKAGRGNGFLKLAMRRIRG